MKKLISITIMLSAIIGCSHQMEPTFAQGDVTKNALLSSYDVFNDNYEKFTLSQEDLAIVEHWPKNLVLDVYFATWCHDSEREVPKLIKFTEANQHISVKLIALDYRKTEPLGRAKANEIQFTPTIVIKLGGAELGRVIERPKQSLIKDIDLMIKKHNA